MERNIIQKSTEPYTEFVGASLVSTFTAASISKALMASIKNKYSS